MLKWLVLLVLINIVCNECLYKQSSPDIQSAYSVDHNELIFRANKDSITEDECKVNCNACTERKYTMDTWPSGHKQVSIVSGGTHRVSWVKHSWGKEYCCNCQGFQVRGEKETIKFLE